MSDDVITVVGALILIGGALCPFFPWRVPLSRGCRLSKHTWRRRKPMKMPSPDQMPHKMSPSKSKKMKSKKAKATGFGFKFKRNANGN